MFAQRANTSFQKEFCRMETVYRALRIDEGDTVALAADGTLKKA